MPQGRQGDARLIRPTNGTLVDQASARGIADVFHYVGVSIDGRPETHDRFRRRTGAFESALGALKLCRDAGAKVGVRDVDSNLATAVRTTVILAFAWLIVLVTRPQPLTTVSGRAWLFLVLSGLATGASWLCYFVALQLGQAAAVASLDRLSLVFTVFLAALILGEPLTPLRLLGAALVVGGVYLISAA